MKTAIAAIFAVMLLAGCSNTMQVLEGADAACADIDVSGYFTQTHARARIVKLPEGATADEATLRALCRD